MEKLKDTQEIRTLFSRKHDVVLPRKGVFLAGPTPFDGEMTSLGFWLLRGFVRWFDGKMSYLVS